MIRSIRRSLPASAIAAWLLFGSAGCTSSATAGERVAAPASVAELEQAIAEVLAGTGAPGVGYVLVDHDGIRHAGGLGLADRASGAAVGTGTLFRWGSISKSFVAVAVLQLQEQGRLELEEEVRVLLPEIAFTNRWEAAHPVRLVHLLEHTTGFDDLHLVEYGYRNAEITLHEALDFHPHSRTARWPPGTHYSYSNSGPAMAAYAVERQTGQEFEAYAAEHILRRLGMSGSGFRHTPEVQRRLATGYRRDGRTVMPYAHLTIRPSGALNATPTELGAFVRMLLGRGSMDGTRILAPESVQRMEIPGSALAARHGLGAGYGLGNKTSPENGFLWRGHTGGIDGFYAQYGYLAEHGVGYAYSVNAESAEAAIRIGKLIRAHLTHTLEPLPPPPAAAGTLELGRYAGYYVSAASRNEVTRFLDRLIAVVHVRERDGRLVAQPFLAAPVELIIMGDGRFRAAEDPLATLLFLQSEQGTFGLEAASGAFGGSFERMPALLVWAGWVAASAAIALMLSALLFALLWVPRKLLGRMLGVPQLSVRALPALAVAFLASGIVLVVLASSNLLVRLGTPTIYSVGFAVLTLLFAVTALAGSVHVFRARPAEVGRGIWWHAALVSGANLLVLLYLGAHGLIGIRFWTF